MEGSSAQNVGLIPSMTFLGMAVVDRSRKPTHRMFLLCEISSSGDLRASHRHDEWNTHSTQMRVPNQHPSPGQPKEQENPPMNHVFTGFH